ncbi:MULTISPECIES: DivIVA domain-containing protein [Micrococcus]|uniref:Cell wall synthesis protein Wag31 n=1 Tax=Micrococcus yunnanensis TaxID=566027 RepID=A0AAP5WDW2_9MICC|nr:MULTISPECIES: DivIVA domain-containing protein [Micrococcus]EZP39313.1 DivIVA domain protein [Micrococcus luteus]MBU8650313.1 DivIVA domain-containing protein [Micrococcus luteus]MDV7177058.1 DivIVA domain-containing protein [Micrococcus yunnanensis]QGS21066.1 DivIVA domain-containing protein [Micrococcus luteus]QHG59964.1 DivIVA domain-containing protein [Micrococcus luteus]
MALSWEDVVNKQFQPTKFREGYDQTEVDDFLDEIVAEFKRLIALNEQLESENAELRAGGAAPAAGPAADTPEAAATPASVEEAAPAAADAAATSAAGVLAMAQRLHDEHVAAGEQRSTELVAEAEATAARLVSDAEEQKARTLEALAEEKAGLEGEVEQLRSFETDYRSRLTSYIEGQLREIRAQKRVEPPTPTA